MITLAALARLAAAHPDDLEQPVAPLRVGGRVVDTDVEPVVMGVVNLSRDSLYRPSISTSTASAVRRGRVLAAQGAHLVDVGAESTNGPSASVRAEQQVASLVPVVKGLAEEGVAVSIEGYDVRVVRAGLEAGACVVNLTGSDDDAAMFDLAAEHGATVVLCHVVGRHARDLTDTDVDADPVPRMLEQFGARLDDARGRGVTDLTVDPGLGFGYRRLTDPGARAEHQASLLLNSFRLRRLGVPVCHAMPHAFDLFEEQYRTAEGFFTVLARLGGTGVFRTHEVPQLVAVLGAMGRLPTDGRRVSGPAAP